MLALTNEKIFSKLKKMEERTQSQWTKVKRSSNKTVRLVMGTIYREAMVQTSRKSVVKFLKMTYTILLKMVKVTCHQVLLQGKMPILLLNGYAIMVKKEIHLIIITMNLTTI